MAMALSLVLLLAGSAAPPSTTESPWARVQFLLGDWAGESAGEPGKGTARRSYRLLLEDAFLHEENVSIYPPQPKNEKGEVHEHWAFFSVDRARHTLVLRQFHQEGFVNQYVLVPGSPAAALVFESEALENVPSGWKARETYDVVSPDEFVETFEIAANGAAYTVYSKTCFKRVRPPTVEAVKALEPLRFLIGEWRGEGTGKAGESGGGFTFASALQGRIVLRASFAEYPAAADRPASRHDDLMVFYASDAGELRADYYDNEGHVIRYVGSAPAPGELTLVSEAAAGSSRFRLSYKLGATGALEGRFEIAPPGKPDAFGPYLAWTARRAGGAPE